MTPRSPRAGEDADDLDVEEALALVNDAHTPGDRPSGDRTHGDDGTHRNGPHGTPVPGAPAHRDGADWTDARATAARAPAGAAATAADTFRPSRSRCPPRSASPWPPR